MGEAKRRKDRGFTIHDLNPKHATVAMRSHPENIPTYPLVLKAAQGIYEKQGRGALIRKSPRNQLGKIYYFSLKELEKFDPAGYELAQNYNPSKEFVFGELNPDDNTRMTWWLLPLKPTS